MISSMLIGIAIASREQKYEYCPKYSMQNMTTKFQVPIWMVATNTSCAIRLLSWPHTVSGRKMVL